MAENGFQVLSVAARMGGLGETDDDAHRMLRWVEGLLSRGDATREDTLLCRVGLGILESEPDTRRAKSTMAARGPSAFSQTPRAAGSGRRLPTRSCRHFLGSCLSRAVADCASHPTADDAHSQIRG